MWRMEGCRATHMLTHTHTHAYTSHTQLHTTVASLCMGLGPPGSSWRLLASAQAKVGNRPSIPVGVTLLLLVAQVLGSGSVKRGKGFLKGTPKPPGSPCSLPLICVLGEPALPGLLQNTPGEE